MKDDIALITVITVVVIELRSIQNKHLKEDIDGLILDIKNEKGVRSDWKNVFFSKISLDILNLSFPWDI